MGGGGLYDMAHCYFDMSHCYFDMAYEYRGEMACRMERKKMKRNEKEGRIKKGGGVEQKEMRRNGKKGGQIEMRRIEKRGD